MWILIVRLSLLSLVPVFAYRHCYDAPVEWSYCVGFEEKDYHGVQQSAGAAPINTGCFERGTCDYYVKLTVSNAYKRLALSVVSTVQGHGEKFNHILVWLADENTKWNPRVLLDGTSFNLLFYRQIANENGGASALVYPSLFQTVTDVPGTSKIEDEHSEHGVNGTSQSKTFLSTVSLNFSIDYKEYHLDMMKPNMSLFAHRSHFEEPGGKAAELLQRRQNSFPTLQYVEAEVQKWPINEEFMRKIRAAMAKETTDDEIGRPVESSGISPMYYIPAIVAVVVVLAIATTAFVVLRRRKSEPKSTISSQTLTGHHKARITKSETLVDQLLAQKKKRESILKPSQSVRPSRNTSRS